VARTIFISGIDLLNLIGQQHGFYLFHYTGKIFKNIPGQRRSFHIALQVMIMVGKIRQTRKMLCSNISSTDKTLRDKVSVRIDFNDNNLLTRIFL